MYCFNWFKMVARKRPLQKIRVFCLPWSKTSHLAYKIVIFCRLYVHASFNIGKRMMYNIFALLYLRSDSTTVPLSDAKLSGPRDAFEKKLLNCIFFELIEKRWHNIQFQLRPFCNASGPLRKFKSSQQIFDALSKDLYLIVRAR